MRSPEQPDLPSAAATGTRRGDTVDAPAAPRLQRIAQVEDPVRRDGERSKPVIFHPVLDLALLGARCTTAFRIGQHRLRQTTITSDQFTHFTSVRVHTYIHRCSNHLIYRLLRRKQQLRLTD